MFKKFMLKLTALFALALMSTASEAQDFSGISMLFVNNVAMLQVTSSNPYLPVAQVSMSLFDKLSPYELVLAIIAGTLTALVALLAVYEFLIKNLIARYKLKHFSK